MTGLRRPDLMQLMLIVSVAAVLRFHRSDVVEYFHDDAMLTTLALELVSGFGIPTAGILSSTGIPNSPASVYIMAIPYSFSADPQFAVHFVMLLNVVGVALLWLLARVHFGLRAAFVAGLVYAINPWAVLFSRKIWAQEIHTPFILLGLLLLLHGFWQRRDDASRRFSRLLSQTLSLPILLFGLQIHFAAWALLPVIPLVIWQGRRQISWRATIMGMLLSIMILLPYARGLTQTLDSDPYRISDAMQRSLDKNISLNAGSLEDLTMLASGIGLESWLAPAQQKLISSHYPALWWLSILLLIPFVVGLVTSYRRQPQWAPVLIIWSFLPALLLLVNWTQAYNHYFIPSIPAFALLIGLGIHHLLERSSAKRSLRLAIWCCLLVIWANQLLYMRAALNYVAEQHITYPGFTTPLSKLDPLREKLRQADDVVIISQGMSWNLHHEVAVWDTLLWDDAACVRTLLGDGYAVFPDHAFSVIIAPDAPAQPANELYATAQPEHFPMRKGSVGYVLHRWDQAPEWTGTSINAIDPVHFDNGVILIGYAVRDDEITLDWRLPGQQVGHDFQYSAQLFDVAGQRVAQLDASFWHGRHWCENDRFLTWGPIMVESQASKLTIAMYRLGTGAQAGQIYNAHVLDELGNPQGQSAEIQL